MTTRPLHLLRLSGHSIFEQLQLEEALLRADHRNWCICNTESSAAIVMGISGKAHQLLIPHFLSNPSLPVIRRFSGGGTVVIDENTCFITFIFNSHEAKVPCCPQKIFQWSEKIYQQVFSGLDFALKENDYVMGHKKFGGNAQYLRKDRWLHHSSLLWDYNPHQMNYLSIPHKAPKYRENRAHLDFLCCLKEKFISKEEIFQKVIQEIKKDYLVIEEKLDTVKKVMDLGHRKATAKVNDFSLEK